MSTNTNGRKVVISGMGALSPIGNDLESTWNNVKAGKGGVDKITAFDTTKFSCQIAAELKDFDVHSVVEKKERKRYDRFSIFALGAAREAWKNAGLESHNYEKTRMGSILGVGIGGLETLAANYNALYQGGPRKVSPFLIPGMISNLAPGHIAIEFGLMGVNYVVTSACTSGTHALGEAYRMVRDGMQDVVLAGGSEAAITELAVAGFARMRALSTRNDEPEIASRPFDKDRDGFVMGEGAAVLVVEAEETAIARGATIYAEVAGYGFSCDAYHITSPSEGGEGAILCMKNAIESANLKPEEVGYINAHGTSTPVNDPAESKAIQKVFGAYSKDGLLISSTKSMTGHLLGAAGGIEAVFSIMALKEGLIPPTINLDEPGEGCELDYVPNTARKADIKYAMSNSFGFGGTNASIVLKKAE